MERAKEYLHGINEGNVMDTCLFQVLKSSWFPVMLDVMFSCRVTFAKEYKAAEICNASLQTNQNTSHLQTSTDVPLFNIF